MGNFFKGKNEEKEENEMAIHMMNQFNDFNEIVTTVCNDLKKTFTHMQDIKNRLLTLEEKTQAIEINAKAKDTEVISLKSESLNCLKLTQLSKKIKKEQVDVPENKKLETSRLLNARIRHKEAKIGCFGVFDNSTISPIPIKTINKKIEEPVIKLITYVPLLHSGKKHKKLESSRVKSNGLHKSELGLCNLDKENLNPENVMDVEK